MWLAVKALILRWVLARSVGGLLGVLSAGKPDAGRPAERRAPTAWIIAACGAIPAVMLLRSLFAFLNAYCMHWVALRVLRDLREKVFARLVGQSLDFFGRARSGELISRVTHDAAAAQFALASVSADLVKQPFAVLIGVGTLLWLDWRFTLACVLLFPLCILPVRHFGKRMRRSGEKEEREHSAMTVTLQETFAGIRVIKSFAREDVQAAAFARSAAEQFRASMKARAASEAVGPMVEAVAALGAGLALLYAYTIGMTSDAFFALLGGTFLLYEPVKTLSKMHLILQQGRAATENIFALLEAEPTVLDLPDARELARPEARGILALEDVTFRYRPELPPALADVTLRFEPGKSYALVGRSGSGKSTVFALLQRFFDPQEGCVSLGGRDVREWTQRSLREQIGVVTQEGFLFHDTVAANIAFGRPGATRGEIEEAARRAHAAEFIERLPGGYETVAGDKGGQLSGGQQQRLAIARTLLKDAPILLLDEATSALDTESERLVQEALADLSAGRTVIAIAHRLSTVLASDEIIVLDEGRVVERGTHAELFARGGLYRKLYDLQFGGGEASEPMASETSANR